MRSGHLVAFLIVAGSLAAKSHAQESPRAADPARAVRVWFSGGGGAGTISGSGNLMRRISAAGSYDWAMLTARRIDLADAGSGSMSDNGLLIGARTRRNSFLSAALGVGRTRRMYRDCPMNVQCFRLDATGFAYELGAHAAARYVSVGIIYGGTLAQTRTSWQGTTLTLGFGRFGPRKTR